MKPSHVVFSAMAYDAYSRAASCIAYIDALGDEDMHIIEDMQVRAIALRHVDWLFMLEARHTIPRSLCTP